MVNKLFKILSPSLQKKYRCDAFLITHESEKNFFVTLLVKKPKIYVPKPNASTRWILKTNLEEYITSKSIKEIQYISKEI
jgi:CRISPR/Cas system CSM-associated protein Csm4 (group 5 of RAMP superfamily)